MAFRPALCPSCGGNLQLPEEREMVKCMYCGIDIVVKDALNHSSGGINPANLLNLASKAHDAGNHSEAISYCNRVLEIQPENHKAWLIKGKSVGQSSTLGNLRISEMVSAFNHAFSSVPEESRHELTKDLATEITRLCSAFYNAVRGHFLDYKDLDGSWTDYLDRCSQLITGLEVAHVYNPTNVQTMRGIVEICQNNIEGETYRYNLEGYSFNGEYRVSAQYESELQQKCLDYAAKIRAIEPDFQPRTIQKKTNDCFIATAAEGSPDAPAVNTLRLFRDQVLSQGSAGRAFIKAYYHYSPPIAKRVEGKAILRLIVRLIVVRPLSWYAGRVIENNES